MSKNFKHSQTSGSEFQTDSATAQQIDHGASVTQRWNKIQADLTALAPAFSLAVPASLTPMSSPAATSSTGNPASVSCLAAVGAQRANLLAMRCQQVSPATHPPCNTQNACVTIVDEIRRGCSMLTSAAPAFCAEYK